ncbi:spore germination protein GerPB [Thalassobacillus sp. CUG 92003]|uniref:spore germination protein GerPB n=1 Tax=Thalassobacillus sp. CUG 92003 TaxID=2736641 RepID=UPI0015E7BD8F|nr:spore germination protein GerPB [Thalassobacillus sp. CUG 92003]
MSFIIHQTISINFIKVGAVTNSSVLQIGSSGIIHAQSDLYNTGGYTAPGAKAQPEDGYVTSDQAEVAILVPLAPIT